ncbi:antirepressor, BRO family protein [Helicobacter apodemus]|uniref:Antirepressor, BRO family protein n=2 Tax=Helicobacter TaxID=209 RepID=A0A4U8UCE7_9HELI|nr:BRO family protein [Helicobacter apodemus]TLE12554.1 antirepressor, BRO family protein [Helicobacter apodemus]
MQLQVFNHKTLGQVRVVGDNENPLFCLRDICEVLEHTNPSRVLEAINAEFGDGLTLSYPIKDNLGRTQQTTFITEPQLYFILMRSDKPKAKPFRQWVVNEVLPSIRKQGYYLTPNVESTLIAELRDSNLSKDSLKRELESLKDELLQTQRELLSFYKFQPKSKVKEHSPDTIAKIQELAKSGVGVSEIVRTLGVSESSVRKYK